VRQTLVALLVEEVNLRAFRASTACREVAACRASLACQAWEFPGEPLREYRA